MNSIEKTVKIDFFKKLAYDYIDKICTLNQVEIHEYLNFLSFYKLLSDKTVKKNYCELSDVIHVKLLPKLKQIYELMVELNVENWNQYAPYPLRFIENIGDNLLGIPEELIDLNLDYQIDQFMQLGHRTPSWNWGESEIEAWQSAKIE